MDQKNNTELLPLDGERQVTFKEGNFPYTFTFSRLTQADWEKYFLGIVSSQHTEGRQQVSVLDLTTPGLAMVEEKLVRAEGYRGEFMSTPGWQKLIPPKHANVASLMLRMVSPATEEDELPMDPEHVEVRINAAWGAQAPGEMKMFLNLAHFFKPVTAEQKKRYYRATSESRVVGGSKTGRTIYTAKHPLMLKLYDELVAEVKGYGVGGQEISTADEAIRHVDAYHKVIAVSQLFIGNMGGAAAEEEAA